MLAAVGRSLYLEAFQYCHNQAMWQSVSAGRMKLTASTPACLLATLTTSAQVSLADASQTVTGMADKSVWRLVGPSVATLTAGAKA